MALRAGTVFHGTVGQPSAQVIDGSLKFDGTSNYLTRSFSAGNRSTWTWAAWVKRYKFGATNYGLFSYYPGSGNGGFIRFSDDDSGDTLRFYSDTNTRSIVSKEKFRDTGWYHIVIAVDTTQGTDTDRVKRYVNGVQQTTNASNTWPSASEELLFNQSGNHFLGRVQASAYGPVAMSQVYFIDGQALGPDSFGFTDPLTNTWRPKKYTGDFNIAAESYSTAIGVFTINNTTPNADSTVAYLNSNPDSSSYPLIQSSQVANNEITVKFTSAQNGVTSIKFKGGGYAAGSTYTLFVNGAQVGGTHSTNTLWAEDSHTISSTNITELKIVGSDGFALGQLKFDDSLVSGTPSYGTHASGVNSFYLPMDGNSPIGQDQSGNGNNWTPQNFSGTSVDPDVLKDSPSGAVSGRSPTSGITTTNFPPSNYATLNPLVRLGDPNATFSDGNLTASFTSANNYAVATIGITTGKYYYELTASTNVSSSDTATYIRAFTANGVDETFYHWRANGGTSGLTGSPTLSTYASGDVLGVAIDATNSKVRFFKNGTLEGSGDYTYTTYSGKALFIAAFANPGNRTCHWNFGQKPFKYAPPDGFQALNLANIRPETVIARPDQYVGVATYTGTGANQRIETGMKPDFVWIKERNGDISHQLYDAVRGVTKKLSSNTTDDETTTSGGLTSFNFNGFTLGDYGSVNTSSDTYVAWSWKAGGNKNTFNVDDVGYASAAAAGLTGGTESVTGASVSTKQGFSIIKWNFGSSLDRTIPHGLTKTPEFYIIKNMGASEQWYIYTTVIDGTLDFGDFDDSGFSASSRDLPTSTLVNYSGTTGDHIMYAWHDVPGLQKFGSYTANNSADGPFVELGFRPAIIWLKPSTRTGNWTCIDVKRDTFNVTTKRLSLNLSTNETDQVGTTIDILSNGFKCRTDSGDVNNSTNTYLYCAWAEAPSVNLYGGQSNAR